MTTVQIARRDLSKEKDAAYKAMHGAASQRRSAPPLAPHDGRRYIQ